MHLEFTVVIPADVYDRAEQWLIETFGPRNGTWVKSLSWHDGYASGKISKIKLSFVNKADAEFFILKWTNLHSTRRY